MELENTIEELETLLQDRETYIFKLEEDVERMAVGPGEVDDNIKVRLHEKGLELQEKEAYIRKLEEHLLSQKPGIATPNPLPELKRMPSMTNSEASCLTEYFTPRKNVQTHMPFHFKDIPNDEKQNIESNNKYILGQLDSTDITSSSESEGIEKADQIRQGLVKMEQIVTDEDDSFGLANEIAELRKDMQNTKAIYAKEKDLLQEVLDREKIIKGSVIGPSHQEMTSVVDLQQKVAVLQETNRILHAENDRWLSRIREQEGLVLQLRQQLGKESGKKDESTSIFGKQLALLQKHRDDLLEFMKEEQNMHENHLSCILGEKAVLEEDLRREKSILADRLRDQAVLDRKLKEKSLDLEKAKQEQRRLEDIINYKDNTEKELMCQKRLLEEELFEIESKLREKEEELDFQKIELLNDLKDKNQALKFSGEYSRPVSVSSQESSDLLFPHEGTSDRLWYSKSVCSDSQLPRMNLLLEHAEKKHLDAVGLLRDQLKSESSLRESRLRRKYSATVSSALSRHHKQLEKLKDQYENQMDSLRGELESERKKRQEMMQSRLPQEYNQVTDSLRQTLMSDQRDQLDQVLENLRDIHMRNVDELQEKHSEDVEIRLQALKVTLEQVYSGQMELVRSDLEQKRLADLLDLRENLTKEHKEELNRLDVMWTERLEQTKNEYEDELNDSLLEDSLTKDETSERQLHQINKQLSKEHSKLLQKITDNLNRTKGHRFKAPKRPRTDSEQQTESEDDNESIRSMPVTEDEFSLLEERQKLLFRAEDVHKTLESQREEISQLRTLMLSEYEELLAARKQQNSQPAEAEKVGEDTDELQQKYEDQMKTFQAKVEAEAEESASSRLSLEHNRELEELRVYYEKKVQEMENSYTEEINALKTKRDQELSELPEDSVTAKSDRENEDILAQERESFKQTTVLTALSDAESSPSASPPKDSVISEPRLYELQQMVAEKDAVNRELQQKLEFEESEAKLFEERLEEVTKKLKELEDELDIKDHQIRDLKNLVQEKDESFLNLDQEKCDMEEKFNRDMEESEKNSTEYSGRVERQG
ncbi:hypothetical protein ScPMuIL_016474 [Solemya velum]